LAGTITIKNEIVNVIFAIAYLLHQRHIAGLFYSDALNIDENNISLQERKRQNYFRIAIYSVCARKFSEPDFQADDRGRGGAARCD